MEKPIDFWLRKGKTCGEHKSPENGRRHGNGPYYHRKKTVRNMAQAELDILLNKLSGRLTGDSKFYTTHRHGKTVVGNYPLHRDPKKVTAQQQAQSDAFGKAVKLCKAEMNNPERLAFWQEQYNQYVKLANKSLSRANRRFFGDNSTAAAQDKYYSTLRGFIIAQLRKERETE